MLTPQFTELISDFLPEEREVQRETAGNQLAL